MKRLQFLASLIGIGTAAKAAPALNCIARKHITKGTITATSPIYTSMIASGCVSPDRIRSELKPVLVFSDVEKSAAPPGPDDQHAFCMKTRKLYRAVNGRWGVLRQT